ncbi:capsule assembly Wzi family protein [Aequorivita echinoideorum]|uniref:Capsule assembly protein Wzi n=1 Tax=Aequorivita echinoideorum TaxID=1549647 RepID=A0ABS5S6A7_9FLAO|nr:capsule assembly Wzi family protein [Aequorivita echinoideorum]MBT0607917.1 hypothetical protein [Aequorivita echinoideorum]
MKKMLPYILLLATALCKGQMEYNGEIKLSALASNNANSPFWYYTNTNREKGEFTNAAAIPKISATYTFERFQLEMGASVFVRDGAIEPVQRGELFIHFSNNWLKATLGAKAVDVNAEGLSMTNKNFIWSGNARPIPGAVLEANEPIKISPTFGIDWGIGHYWLNDERYVEDTRLHYKRLGIKTTFNENHQLFVRLQHFVQWGGTSPEFGKLRSGLKDFFYIFAASETTETNNENETANALGNHLGSIFGDYTFKYPIGNFSVYHDHPFEDGSGTRFANFLDGLWGVFFQPTNKRFFSGILYEYTDTVDQSGISVGSGFDNYFSHSLYRSGWTYEGNIIGLPFILANKNMNIAEDGTPIFNNRSKVHHLALKGNFKNFEWMLKTTYAKYLGTYGRPLFPERKDSYNFASISYKTKDWGTFKILGEIDFSNTESTIGGAGVEYQYHF